MKKIAIVVLVSLCHQAGARDLYSTGNIPEGAPIRKVQAVEGVKTYKTELPAALPKVPAIPKQDITPYIGIIKAFKDAGNTDEYKKSRDAFVEDLKKFSTTYLKLAVARMDEGQKDILNKIAEQFKTILEGLEEGVKSVKEGMTAQEKLALNKKLQMKLMGSQMGLMFAMMPFAKALQDPSVKVPEEEMKDAALYWLNIAFSIVRELLAITL